MLHLDSREKSGTSNFVVRKICAVDSANLSKPAFGHVYENVIQPTRPTRNLASAWTLITVWALLQELAASTVSTCHRSC